MASSTGQHEIPLDLDVVRELLVLARPVVLVLVHTLVGVDATPPYDSPGLDTLLQQEDAVAPREPVRA